MMDMIDGRAYTKMAKAAASGFQHGKYEGNELQLPALLILDPMSRVQHVHYGKTVSDIPDVEQLAALLAD